MKRVHTNITEKTGAEKSDYRGRTELLKEKAKLLSGADKVLMLMYLDAGSSIRQLARLISVHEAKVSRKIDKLIKQLNDRRYIICLCHRDRFTRAQLRIARDYFVRGLSIRQMAEQTGCTYYRMRRTVNRITEMIDTLGRQTHKAKANQFRNIK